MNPDRYYLVDGDHMHGPMSWDDLRAMLESGTVGADAQWCREGETEFRPLSDLMPMAAVAPVAVPPTIVPVYPVAIRAAMVAPPVVVHVHAPARSTTAAKVQAGAIATIAAVIAGPVVLSVIGSVLIALVVVFAILISSGSSQGKSAATPPASAQPAGPEHAPR